MVFLLFDHYSDQDYGPINNSLIFITFCHCKPFFFCHYQFNYLSHYADVNYLIVFSVSFFMIFCLNFMPTQHTRLYLAANNHKRCCKLHRSIVYHILFLQKVTFLITNVYSNYVVQQITINLSTKYIVRKVTVIENTTLTVKVTH